MEPPIPFCPPWSEEEPGRCCIILISDGKNEEGGDYKSRPAFPTLCCQLSAEINLGSQKPGS